LWILTLICFSANSHPFTIIWCWKARFTSYQKTLYTYIFNKSLFLIMQLCHFNHFSYFAYNRLISHDIMAVLLLLNSSINLAYFQAFDSKYSIFLSLRIGNNWMLIFTIVELKKTWTSLWLGCCNTFAP